MKKLFLFLTFAVSFFLTACNSTDPDIINPPAVTTQGVYVLNEGGFGQNNSEITFFDIRKQTAAQNVFSGANSGGVLGDVANDMKIYNGKGYIVIHGSNKVEIVDLKDFKRIGVIDLGAAAAPRNIFITGPNDAFVTGFSDKVFHLNISNFTVKNTTTVGSKPEGIVEAGGKLFVAVSGLGQGYQVEVLNANTLAKTGTIQVGVNPTQIIRATDGKIYVVCRGAYDAVGRGMIYRIDPVTAKATDSVEVNGNPSDITLFKNMEALLLVNAGVARVNLATMSMINPVFINGATVNPIYATAYALAYDPVDDRIYVGNPRDFVQSGEIVIYDGAGTEIKRFEAGINPALAVVARF